MPVKKSKENNNPKEIETLEKLAIVREQLTQLQIHTLDLNKQVRKINAVILTVCSKLGIEYDKWGTKKKSRIEEICAGKNAAMRKLSIKLFGRIYAEQEQD